MSTNAPAAQPPVDQVVVRITRPLGEYEVRNLQRQHKGLDYLTPLHPGLIGYLPRIAKNFSPSGHWNAYVNLILLEYGRHGLQPLSLARKMPDAPDGAAMAPMTHLELCAPLNRGRWPVQFGSSPPIPRHPSISTVERYTSKVHGFLTLFFSSLALPENLELLKSHGAHSVLLSFIAKKSNQAELVDKMLSGMRALDSFRFLNQLGIEFKTLFDEANSVNIDDSNNPVNFKREDHDYIYLLVYYSKKHDTNPAQTHRVPRCAAYIGRTIKPAQRLAQHLSGCGATHPKTNHWRIGKDYLEQGQLRMIPLTMTSKNKKEHPRGWAFAELAMICLLNTWNPCMIAASDPDIVVPVLPSGRQLNVSTSSYQKSCSSTLAHHLRNLSADVGTNNMIASYDRFGCNWSIPVLESVYFGTNVWVRTTFLDRDRKPQMYSFATSPRRISNNNKLYLFGGREGTFPQTFEPTISVFKYPEIPAGTMVHVVIEIMAQDISHEKSYIQTPAVGPYDQWQQASRVAIRLEYRHGNQWKSQYVRRVEIISLLTTQVKSFPGLNREQVNWDLDHLELGWLQCMKVLYTLMRGAMDFQGQDTAELCTKILCPYLTNVREYRVNVLQQQFEVGKPNPMKFAVPRRLSFDEIANRLDARLRSDPNSFMGTYPGAGSLVIAGNERRPPRQKCDLCFAISGSRDNQMGAHHVARRCHQTRISQQVEGGSMVETCEFSRIMNRPCTWTRDIITKRQYKDIVFHPLVQFPATSIPDPECVFDLLESIEGSAVSTRPEDDIAAV